MLRQELYLRETIKRINDQEIVCEDNDESRKKSVKFIDDMMFLLGIEKKNYNIQFDRTALSNGRIMEKVSLVLA